MQLNTERCVIRPLSTDHSQHLFEYINSNQAHLAKWEPHRDQSYYSLEATELRLSQYQLEYENNGSLHLAAFNQQGSEILALCSFTNIVQGPFQACYLGYSVAQQHQGKGLMTEVLGAALDYVFNVLSLHRVMANYMPANVRSEALLNKLGFEREGLAKAYLKIAGSWQDHVLTAKINQRD